MKYFLISPILFMLLLTGCAANRIQEPTFASQTICPICHHVHHSSGGKLSATPSRRFIHSPSTINKNFLKKPVKMGQSTPILKDGFATVTYHVDQQPIIQTMPFQITVIRLEPGEKFTNISSGDPSRWSYAVAVSGKDENAQQNILVKPSLPDISTNLVITTDKRLYNLHLVANQTHAPTRSVDFWYPDEPFEKNDDMLSVTEEPIAENPCKKASLHHYCITTAGFFSRPPPWQPVRVFDDGEHTTIQFPDNVSQQDLPALFIVNNGQKACVNYHFNSPYMVVDKLFNEATLVSGVGASQQAVWLTQTST